MTRIDPGLLKILRCPETQQSLKPAEAAVIEKLNQQISSGQLNSQSGQLVSEKLDSGLVREDGKRLYPVRHDIPVMLADESIPLN